MVEYAFLIGIFVQLVKSIQNKVKKLYKEIVPIKVDEF